MRVDYRGLNSVTKSDMFPLPRIDDLLDQLGNSRFFTTLDLAAGYWQVQVDQDSQEKTAFITPTGLYEFRLMPFGLTNAPTLFQRLMERVLEGLNAEEKKPFVEVYIDDVLFHSESMGEHVRHLEKVLERFRCANLKLRLDKCQKTVDYLGYQVTPNGLGPTYKQVEAVENFPMPTTVAAVRQFLGLASFYRRFVNNFSTVAEPLHRLTRKNVTFRWTSECQNSFKELKKQITEAPILAYPNFSCPFYLETDASQWIGSHPVPNAGRWRNPSSFIC